MALSFAIRLQVRRISGDTVIVDVLAIGHIGDLRVAAHAKGTARALVDVLHLDFLPGQGRLAKAVIEQFLGNVAVLLTDFDVEPLALTVHHTGLGPRFARQQRQQQRPSHPTHLRISEKLAAMLQNIPTHVIAGPLGAGKTSLIRQLMAQRPAGERWAVLINEFGQIGLDAALLSRDAAGTDLAEVAGGCLCCVNGAPFQIGLARLLRKAQPDRLFIEPSGLGHPLQLLRQLSEAPWQGVLAVQPSVLVLDAQALHAGQALPAAQQQALGSTGLLLMNKAEGLDEDQRQKIARQLPPVRLIWTRQAQLSLGDLPGLSTQAMSGANNLLMPEGPTQLPAVWSDPTVPICLSQAQEGGWSIGWRWHPHQTFDKQRVAGWLKSLHWKRAKLVIHSADGWVSANALDNASLEWQTSEWRKDSRIELIFAEAQNIDQLQAGLARCRLP